MEEITTPMEKRDSNNRGLSMNERINEYLTEKSYLRFTKRIVEELKGKE